jgi:2-desacetyl-2-hydroxyethyl bacteriochlorophyllide A dehydrogenase
VVDVDGPEGDGVLLKVDAVSICASDFIYLGWGSREIAGHEISGTASDGTSYAVEGIFGCGTCDVCLEGHYNWCERCTLDVLGMTVPGGMSEYFMAPARALTALPEGLRAADASLVEPCSVAWHACAVGGVGPHTRVVVVGGGAIGLMAVAAAKQMGAEEVALEARHPHQRELGERLGASLPSGPYDVVIEAAGSESSVARSIELARHRGVISYVGVFDESFNWPHQAAFAKEVSIAGALGYGPDGDHREFETVAAMLAAQPDLVDALITHRFGIEEAERAFETARDRSAGAIRVVVHPNG